MTDEKEKMTILADPESFRTELVDSVRIQTREGIAVLDLLQRLPDGMVEDSDKVYRIGGRYAFTWKQIESLKDMLQRSLDKHKAREEGDACDDE